jgi:hypothetical protein
MKRAPEEKISGRIVRAAGKNENFSVSTQRYWVCGYLVIDLVNF